MTNQNKKFLSISDLEPIAREATQNAFEHALSNGYSWLSPEQEEKLTLGKIIKGAVCIFQLYIAADNPNDTLFVSRVFTDRCTGELIGDVEVYLPPMLITELPER